MLAHSLEDVTMFLALPETTVTSSCPPVRVPPLAAISCGARHRPATGVAGRRARLGTSSHRSVELPRRLTFTRACLRREALLTLTSPRLS